MPYYPPGALIPSRFQELLAEQAAREAFPFTRLPAELRNKIYEMIFEECIVEILFLEIDADSSKPFQKEASDPKQHPRKGRHGWRKKKVKRVMLPPFTHKVFPPVRRLEWTYTKNYRISAGLLFVSKTVHSEAITFLYSNTTFRLAGNDVMDAFIERTSPLALRHIRCLELTYESSPEPELTQHQYLKTAADMRWSITCENLRKWMSSLKHLKLDLTLRDWPVKLQFNENWAKAVLNLRGDGLDRCDGRVNHIAFDEQTLKKVSRELESVMMSAEGKLIKEKQDRRFREEVRKDTPIRARRVLIIKMDANIPTKKPERKQRRPAIVNAGEVSEWL